MQKIWIAVVTLIFGLGVFFGFRTSNATGIQPGYFEKKEAPAYGVAEDTTLGSNLGKEYEEYFKNLYKEE